jgi:hypothetical protein
MPMKSKTHRVPLTVAALIACCVLTSCIQYVKGDLPSPPELAKPPAGFAKLSATYELSLNQITVPDQGEPEEFVRMERGEFPEFQPGTDGAAPWMIAACKNSLIETLSSSGYFSTIEDSVERGDVHFKITTVDHGSSFLAMTPGVWACFALVLPAWASDERIIHVEVLQNEHEPASYDTKTKIMTLGWTPLMLAAPFQERPDNRNTRIFRAAFRDVLARMNAAGAFSARP